MGLNKPELARLFFLEVLKINGNKEWTDLSKSAALSQLLELIFLEATKEENIQFTTLFARISYASHKFNLHKKTQYWIHFFRRKIRQGVPKNEETKAYQLGLHTIANTIEGVFGTPVSDEVQALLPKKFPYSYSEVKVQEFRKYVRVVALQDDAENNLLLAKDELHPAETIYVQYNIAERNEPFNPTIREIRQTFGFPITLSLIDVEITAIPNSQQPTTNSQSLAYRPRAIIIDPDYLLDVSTVAGCFFGNYAEPYVYLLQKFMTVEPAVPLLLGNIANLFLDELMHRPGASFSEVFPRVFKLSPLAVSMLTDREVREIMQSAQRHWVTLQCIVNRGMKHENIEPAECYLEPSFYDEKHGLQGRLDVLYLKEKSSAIIELKSGSAFMPNRFGIGASHYIQTLLYDLMVRSTFGDKVEPSNYILYSKLETSQLKYAPPVKSEQNEALQVRNQLVAIDCQLAAISENVAQAPVLEKLTISRFPQLKGFIQRDLELFEKTYTTLTPLERSYFNAFCGFIAREHRLAKTGVQGLDKANGLASLWLDTNEEKEANYEIISSLKIKENNAFEEEPIIVFEKSPDSNPLANFRVGDIAVLYPRYSPQPTIHNPQSTISNFQFPVSCFRSPVTTQIFKVTILGITPEQVVIRLRYKQFNLKIFSQYEFWNLEHDQMDFGFNAMYKGLFRFAQNTPQKRKLLLTTQAPEELSLEESSPLDTELEGATDEQKRILQKMLKAKDYFLLWGPPGTGKTSRMLKHFAAWIFKHSKENLLLLAYTNRAVDEICEAIESIDPEIKKSYLRIGSPYSTGERFENQLLSKKLEAVKTRAELKEVLARNRIVVSTLASLSGNLELLKLKKFRRVVIDEASQILEPSLVGLLPEFEQFILIGDHKQLPAVVIQDEHASSVNDKELSAIGLSNLRNSLFERLYRRCCKEHWHWAFDHLSLQGRMHEDIMQFPGQQFYEGKLDILPSTYSISQRQKEPLPIYADNQLTGRMSLLNQNRMVFLSTEIDESSLSWKTNRNEADLVAEIVQFLGVKYAHLKSKPSIGVITPYRAQIALIQDVLQSKGISHASITVDTVERYQGGARDIIIISLCINSLRQLSTLISLSEEGVDRKLNVALTRAKEQVIILGNEPLLRKNALYSKLIDYCASNNGAPNEKSG